MANTKSERYTYAHQRHRISKLFYALYIATGIACMIGSLVYIISVFEPRYMGDSVTAKSYAFRTANEDPESAKMIEYVFRVDDKEYRATEEVSDYTYKQRPATFTVWYLPGNIDGDKFTSVRDWGDILVAIVIFGAGILFCFLPKTGRAIDRSIEGTGGTKQIKACVCGRTPNSKITINETSVLRDRVYNKIFISISLVILGLFFLYRENIFMSEPKLAVAILIAASVTLIPFVYKCIKVRHRLAAHTMRCFIRYAWVNSRHPV